MSPIIARKRQQSYIPLVSLSNPKCIASKLGYCSCRVTRQLRLPYLIYRRRVIVEVYIPIWTTEERLRREQIL